MCFPGDGRLAFKGNENVTYCDDCVFWNSDVTSTVELIYVL